MPKTESKSAQLFADIINEQGGYKYGQPKRVDEKSLTVLLPIIRETTHKRNYTTFPEVDNVLVFDTGKIDEMDAENKGEGPVFIRSGTLFKGATQERALQRSEVVMSKSKRKLSVRCVHQTRGIQHNATVTYGGITPTNMHKKCYTSGFTPKDQYAYWKNVHDESTVMSRCATGGRGMSAGSVHAETSDSPQVQWLSGNLPGGHEVYNANTPFTAFTQKTDDLASNLDKFAKDFEKILSKVKLEENQAGTALITDDGVQTIEVFDHPESWKALHHAAVKSMGTELVKEDDKSVFEFKPEHAKGMVNKVLSMDWQQNTIYNHESNNGDPAVRITGITAKGYVGEVVEIGGTIAHIVVLKQA